MPNIYMLKKIFIIFILLLSLVLANTQAVAQENVQADYYQARVVEIKDIEKEEVATGLFFAGESQEAKVKILEGPKKNEETVIEVNALVRNGNENKIESGEKIIVGFFEEQNSFFYVDRYRIGPIIWIFVVFLVLVIVLTKRKGFLSILGLMLSVAVVLLYLVPSIYNGANPLIVTAITILTAGIFSFYLAHGFNRRTHVALLSAYLTLILAGIIAVIFTNWAKISGGGTEETQALQFGAEQAINLKSLYLAGIMISALGVLDDITTAQSAVVEQLKKANSKLNLKELYTRSLEVGREHIASLVNTLAFAYVGSSLPLLLAFSYNNFQPWWLTLNTEILTQEIVMILVGSMALVLSVPISSFLAAKAFASKEFTEQELSQNHHHSH
ncbi:YibE/F family protein [Candidatus Gracilibacteria bacterium]|nr:YibE/F family protein [Candidatus Gracilibacteria bacterium]NJS41076.1 YibE/F family protein [Candidatus Gracilibacteria bacterium]